MASNLKAGRDPKQMKWKILHAKHQIHILPQNSWWFMNVSDWICPWSRVRGQRWSLHWASRSVWNTHKLAGALPEAHWHPQFFFFEVIFWLVNTNWLLSLPLSVAIPWMVVRRETCHVGWIHSVDYKVPLDEPLLCVFPLDPQKHLLHEVADTEVSKCYQQSAIDFW